MKPTVGRILQVQDGGEWKAALVVDVDPRFDTFVARVFDPHVNGSGVAGASELHDANLQLAVTDENHAWRWPPREG